MSGRGGDSSSSGDVPSPIRISHRRPEAAATGDVLRRRHENLLAAALYALLAMLTFGASFLPDRLFVPMHTGRFEPWRSTTHAEAQAELASGEFADASDKLISFRADDEITARAFREGRIPLWNPTNGGGVPHLGMGLYGVFYPPHWIYRFVAPERAYGFLAAFHHFLAAFFTFLYVRAIGGRFGGSLLAGLAFGFSTCLLARAHYYQYVESLAWLPLALLCVEGWMRRRSVAALGLLALVMGTMLLVGWPQMAAFAGFLCFLSALVRGIRVELKATSARLLGGFLLVLAAFLAIAPFFRDPLPLVAAYPAASLLVVFCASPGKRAFLLGCGGVAAALLLGAAIAAVQYAPIAEWSAGFGSRAPSAPEEMVANGLRPRFLLGLLLPDFFGRAGDPGVNEVLVSLMRVLPLSAADVARLPIATPGNFIETACHFGWLPLLAAVLGLSGRSPRRVFLAISLVWFGGYALGVREIVYPAFFSGFVVGNDPRRALVVAVLIASILAGLGYDRLARLPRVAGGLAIALLAAAGTLLVVLLLGGEPLRDAIVGHATAVARELGLGYEATPGFLHLFDLVRERLVLHIAVAGSLTVLALFAIAMPRLRRFALPAALLAVALDLSLASRPFLATQPRDGFLSDPPLAAKLRGEIGLDGRIARLGRSDPAPTELPLSPNFAGCFDLRDAFCYTVSPSRRFMRLADAIVHGAPLTRETPTFVGEVGILPLDPGKPEALVSRAYQLMAIRAALGSGAPPANLPPGVTLDPERFGDCYVLHTAESLPRAFTVAAAEIAPEGAEPDVLANRVLDESFDPRTTVLLESPLEIPDGEGALPTARIVRDDDRGLEIALEGGTRGGILVVHDNYAPGWTARIDGAAAAPVRRANFAFRAVPFPSGARSVELEYRPRAFTLGAAISIGAVTFAIVLLVVGALRRPLQPRRTEL